MSEAYTIEDALRQVSAELRTAADLGMAHHGPETASDFMRRKADVLSDLADGVKPRIAVDHE